VHLRADTHAGNIADAVRRGRRAVNRPYGNCNPAVLTHREVSLIKYFLQLGWTPIQLAERYLVAPQTISLIKHGRSWSDVQPFQPIPGEPLPVPPGIKPTAPLVRRL
jgi:hypothetical protein